MKNVEKYEIKVKVKVHTLDIVPLCSETSPQKRSDSGGVSLTKLHSNATIRGKPELSISVSILMAIFPGEPELTSFIGAKDDGSVGDNWCYKRCKAPV